MQGFAVLVLVRVKALEIGISLPLSFYPVAPFSIQRVSAGLGLTGLKKFYVATLLNVFHVINNA